MTLAVRMALVPQVIEYSLSTSPSRFGVRISRGKNLAHAPKFEAKWFRPWFLGPARNGNRNIHRETGV
jgi:hypothetical protein